MFAIRSFTLLVALGSVLSLQNIASADTYYYTQDHGYIYGYGATQTQAMYDAYDELADEEDSLQAFYTAMYRPDQITKTHTVFIDYNEYYSGWECVLEVWVNFELVWFD
jgi:hypothetical protein